MIKKAQLSTWGLTDRLLLGLVIVITVMMMTLSIMRYIGYNANMFDLGNMAQSIWSGTQGRPLEFTYRGAPLSRLALHVELFYFLLVPIYALFPTPLTILVVQALMFGSGAFPVYRLARRRLGSINAARALTAIYLLYPVAQTAVLFDFHGDTLAMPLLLFALEALDRESWSVYFIWVGLALSCKFYVAFPISLLGIKLWLEGRRRIGGITMVSGVVWGVLSFFVIRPLFVAVNIDGVEQASALGYLNFYFGQLLTELSISWQGRLLMALIVFMPVLILGWKAVRWFILTAIIALPILLSTGPGTVYHIKYHHYAILVPFLMAVIIFGAERLSEKRFSLSRKAKRWRDFSSLQVGLGATLVLTLLLNSEFVDTPLSPKFWSGSAAYGMGEWKYGRNSRDVMKDEWLQESIPAYVPLTASPFLAPHLAHRETLHLFRSLDKISSEPTFVIPERVEHVVLDGLFDYVEPFGDADFGGGVLFNHPTIQAVMRNSNFDLVSARDGLLLFKFKPATGEILQQSFDLREENNATYDYSFGDKIGLVAAHLKTVGDKKYSLEYQWLPLQPLSDVPQLIAVSTLRDVSQVRFLHLPTFALHPTTEWKVGEIVTEKFEFRLPEELEKGEYVMIVGWYSTDSMFAYATDERSRVGAELEIGVLEFE